MTVTYARQGTVSIEGGDVWYGVVGEGDATPLIRLHGGPGAGSATVAGNKLFRTHFCRLKPLPEALLGAADDFGREVYQTMWGPNDSGTLAGYECIDDLAAIRVPTLFACGRLMFRRKDLSVSM